MAPSPPLQHPAAHPARHLAWLLVLAVAIHAFALAGRIANPLVYSDNWTFMETFLQVALEDGAGFGDYLVKRAGVDHAQPLGKLVMLANARWFGLDFTLESFFAIACALAGWGVLCAAVLREYRQRAEPVPALVAWVLATALALQLAPASMTVYVYPMVMMVHAFYLCAFVVLAAAWHAYRRGSTWPLVAATAICGIVGDDSAILLAVAVVPALLLAARLDGEPRRAWRVAGILVLVLLACRGVYAAFGEIRGSTHPDFNVDVGTRVAGLLAQWRDAWQWVATPLTGGLAALPTLRWMVGEQAWLPVRIGAALVIAAGHAWFWWRAGRQRPGATWFFAVSLMLFFYAVVAGVLYGRVFVRGSIFLDQGRYAVFYQANIVALLLMAVAGGVPRPRMGRRVAWLALVLLLALQVPLSRHAWHMVPYHRAAFVNMARDMAAMGRDPVHPPVPCMVGLDVCVRPEATRVALMSMLVERQLNLFSPQFRARHPELAKAAGELPSRAPEPD